MFTSPYFINYRTFTTFVFVVVAEGDPENYLTFFKRGTVYLALGKAKLAISDLDRVIQLKPDFTAVSIVQKRKYL